MLKPYTELLYLTRDEDCTYASLVGAPVTCVLGSVLTNSSTAWHYELY